MDRREFVLLGGAGLALANLDRAAASASEAARKPPGKRVKMHLGTQHGPTSPEMLQYFKRHGVDAICGYPYMVMPDHVPHHPADPGGLQALAFSYGYIKAILQAVNGDARAK